MADPSVARLTQMIEDFKVAPGVRVGLAEDFDPGFTGHWVRKKESTEMLKRGIEMLASYQDRLAAQSTYGLLVVLQGIDASGKDGTIRHVMSGVNPQGVTVHSFKVPSNEELGHDFLWRYSLRLPSRGQIGIYNRSHYEEVLVVRVHPDLLDRQRLPPQARGEHIWHRRYREINDWERYLVDNGVRIVKLFLNLSREEQRRRFLKRIDRSDKNWKFAASDVNERAHWDEYQHASSEMLSHTSTEHAPWFVIPADHKWFTRVAVAAAIVSALAAIDPRYPVVDAQTRRELEAARAQLEAEAT